jgi:hypothetical protein
MHLGMQLGMGVQAWWLPQLRVPFEVYPREEPVPERGRECKGKKQLEFLNYEQL